MSPAPPLRPEPLRFAQGHLHGEEQVFAGDRVLVVGLAHGRERCAGTLREHGGGVAGSRVGGISDLSAQGVLGGQMPLIDQAARVRRGREIPVAAGLRHRRGRR